MTLTLGGGRGVKQMQATEHEEFTVQDAIEGSSGGLLVSDKLHKRIWTQRWHCQTTLILFCST